MVGSALVRIVEAAGDSDELAAKVGEAARALVEGIREGVRGGAAKG